MGAFMHTRIAEPSDWTAIEHLVIESFEPITWARTLDERFGPLNGLAWRDRWKLRLSKIFQEQIILIGVIDGEIAGVSTSTIDSRPALAYIDILAVSPNYQKQGLGREMLRATIAELQRRGAQFVNLDCLTNNEKANELYQSEGFEEVARHIRWFRRI